MFIRNLPLIWRMIRIPGMLPIMRDHMATVRMHFLYAALDARLLAALTPCANREALLNSLNVKRPELLDALLDLGLSLKEISLHNGIYRLRGKRAKVLAHPGGDALAAVIQADTSYYCNAYRHLADRMRGAPLGDDLADIGEIVARFGKLTEPMLQGHIRSLVNGSQSLRLLDVGCGSGFILRTAHQANHGVTGTGIDTDVKVADQARRNLEQWGISDHFSILAGDIRNLAERLSAPFDLISAFNTLYYFPHEERIGFFHLLSTLLAAKGRLVIVNTFQSRGKDTAAANLNIVNCSLNHLTPLPDLDTTKAQLIEAGFSRIAWTKFMPGSEFYGISAYV